jgi:hypothetical protein
MRPRAAGAPYHPRTVHLRRAILLFALVLGLTALAASVAPTHQESGTVAAPAPPAPPQASLLRTVTFATEAGAKPRTESARTGEHLLVSVASAQGGLVTIPKLGRTASADVSSPAEFDLLAPAAGRYDVLFSGGGVDEPQRVGTLLTRP